MVETTYCVRHPSTETKLACGRCNEPVCPRCMVHAPVGVRCPDCAQAKPIPTFDVSTSFIARGLGAGIGIALASSIAISLLVKFLLDYPEFPFGIIRIGTAALVAVMGVLVSEGISMAVNRKRGGRLKIVAGLSMFVGITVITVFTSATFDMLVLLASGLAFYFAVNRF